MITKTVEIRDSATFIPALAVKLRPETEPDRYPLARAGYGLDAVDQAEYVLLAKLDGGVGTMTCDPYDWPGGARTMQVAHTWLIDHFDELESGAVVDVEFILGLTSTAKLSEAGS